MTASMLKTVSMRAEGTATVVSSIIHSGESYGTHAVLRREKIVQPDGTVLELPVISGNAWRGILRDVSADMLWRQLGAPKLDLAVFHALFSGGALAKAGAGHVMLARDLQRLRDLVPHIGLFGCAGGGRIIEGKLQVGKMMPVCAETSHILPEPLRAEGLPSIWSQLQIEEYTRTDDARKADSARYLNPAKAGEITAGPEDGALIAVAPPAETEPVKDGPAQQMRYGVETIAAGTRLHVWIGLRNVTELEFAWFAKVLAAWSETGHVGGRSAVGHGRLALDTPEWQTAIPSLTGQGGGVNTTELPDVNAWTAENRVEILDALAGLV